MVIYNHHINGYICASERLLSAVQTSTTILFYSNMRQFSLVLIIFEQNALNYSIPRIYLRCFNIITLGKNISHDKTHKKAS